MSVPDFAGSDLPPLIQRALSRVWKPDLELTPSERLALATLVARAEAKDGSASFWVRCANVAQLFDRVDRTVSAWLAALEAKGWIEKEQGRTRWGSFQCLTVNLTRSAQTYLGLVKGADISSTYRPQRKFSADGNKDQGLRHSSSKRHPAGSVDNSDGDRRDVLAGQGVVPQDLALLVELGLSPRAIFSLMALASRNGKRLGAVVAAKAGYLRTARNPFAVLRRMATDGVDYAAVSQQSAQRQARESEATERQQALRRARSEYEGHFTRGKCGEILYIRCGLPEVHGEHGLLSTVVGPRALRILEWIGLNRPPRVSRPGELLS